MRLTRKRVSDARRNVDDTIRLVFKSNDEQLFTWGKKIMPILEKASREELIRLIIVDIVDRALSPLQ